MTQQTDPEILFSSFNVYNQIRPMLGTYHVIDIQIDNSAQVLENIQLKDVNHFHDSVWLKTMGLCLAYTCNQTQALFGLAGSYNMLLVYSLPATQREGTGLLATCASAATSFLSSHTGTPARFSGKVMEFPEPKIMAAYFLWKQNENRNVIIQSIVLEALMSRGNTFEQAREMLMALSDLKSKLSLVSDFLQVEKIPQWLLNGICTYWKIDNNELKLSLNQTVPDGPDFLSYMVEIFEQNTGTDK
ncbi:hypothetical protein KKF34_18695 [Myxococcota bacterium]|nr:hypothetical protein [Myxococcota bacterium]MBU1380781.1 hypothetical protein [Myxococcota bacterium]MBU1498915.1 hypothetical protein [Myxococcota bacterium]